MSELKIVSSDGKEFSVTFDVAKLSGVWENMIEGIEKKTINLNSNSLFIKKKDVTEVSAPYNADQVHSVQLQKVIDYLEFCKKNPVPPAESQDEISKKKRQDIQSWEKEYVPEEMADLIKLMDAAHWLEVKPLLTILSSKFVDSYILDKRPEQIKEIFSVQGDLTLEADIKLRQDHPWAHLDPEKDFPKPKKEETKPTETKEEVVEEKMQ